MQETKKSASPAGSELSKPLLQRLTDYMKGKLSSRIYVEDLASESNMSTFHFARSFKKTTGHSPHKYLTTMRVEQAIQLLPNYDMSLADVASESGFSDQAHFTRVFKKQTGMTPAAHRRKLKKEAAESKGT
ncbi:helix-turn-helix domain-containing protein [Rubritalea marina]|uniref:helix-turn-helix domain-containing protein n=1 Tax=Rubritalea marina TaxID=361055 RepID=UPI0003A0C5B4|nr:AraC family transcriptional regulator [Rubritalea marina]